MSATGSTAGELTSRAGFLSVKSAKTDFGASLFTVSFDVVSLLIVAGCRRDGGLGLALVSACCAVEVALKFSLNEGGSLRGTAKSS